MKASGRGFAKRRRGKGTYSPRNTFRSNEKRRKHGPREGESQGAGPKSREVLYPKMRSILQTNFRALHKNGGEKKKEGATEAN